MFDSLCATFGNLEFTLIRLGIRGFNPKLNKAAERRDGLRTPEGAPIPPNTLAELRRDMVRRRLVNDQIREIENVRLEHLEQVSLDMLLDGFWQFSDHDMR